MIPGNLPTDEVVEGAIVECDEGEGTLELKWPEPPVGFKGQVQPVSNKIIHTYTTKTSFSGYFKKCKIRENKVCILNLYDYWQNTGTVKVNSFEPKEMQQRIKAYYNQAKKIYLELKSLFKETENGYSSVSEMRYLEIKYGSINYSFSSIEDAEMDLDMMNQLALELAKKTGKYDPNVYGPASPNSWKGKFDSQLMSAHFALNKLRSLVNSITEKDKLTVIMSSELPCWEGGLITITDNGPYTIEYSYDVDQVWELLQEIYEDGKIADTLKTRGYDYNAFPMDMKTLETTLYEGYTSQIIEDLTRHYASLCFQWTFKHPVTKVRLFDDDVALEKRDNIVKVLKLLDPPIRLLDEETNSEFHGVSRSCWQLKLLWNIDSKIWEKMGFEGTDYPEVHSHAYDVYRINSLFQEYDFQSAAARHFFIAHATHECAYGHKMSEVRAASRGYPEEFKGAGLLQLTWQYNYVPFANHLVDDRGVISNDEALLIKYLPEDTLYYVNPDEDKTAREFYSTEDRDILNDGTIMRDLLGDDANIRAEYSCWNDMTPTEIVAEFWPWDSGFWFFTNRRAPLYEKSVDGTQTVEEVYYSVGGAYANDDSLENRIKNYEWLEGAFDE